MRAAISHHYGHVRKQGTQAFVVVDEVAKMATGNPSLSSDLGQYMVSLRRRKVRTNSTLLCDNLGYSAPFPYLVKCHLSSPQSRSGEVVTSARAITSETIRSLYEFNHRFTLNNPGTPAGVPEDAETDWGGARIRLMLHALYVVSFLCLLRYDKALQIQAHDLEWVQKKDGTVGLKLSLPFRKTSQYGGKSCPIRIWPDPVPGSFADVSLSSRCSTLLPLGDAWSALAVPHPSRLRLAHRAWPD
jgi:hypothetical protein